MPMYSAICTACGTEHSYVRKVADRAQTPECCGASTVKMVEAAMVGAMSFAGTHMGFVAHRTDGTPVQIDTGADYKRFMKTENKLSFEEGKVEAGIQETNRIEKHDKARRAAAVEAYRQHAN